MNQANIDQIVALLVEQRLGDHAVCPKFRYRVDYQNRSAIQCQDQALIFPGIRQRDDYYHAVCCGIPRMCEIIGGEYERCERVLPMRPEAMKEEESHE